MIPRLLVSELIDVKQKTLSLLVGDRVDTCQCSGEINCKVKSVEDSLFKVNRYFEENDEEISRIGGLSMSFSN